MGQERRRTRRDWALPDPGDRRRCEHKSSFQHPKLSHFCQTNYFRKGNISSETVFILALSWKECDWKSHLLPLTYTLPTCLHSGPGGSRCRHLCGLPRHGADTSLKFLSALPSCKCPEQESQTPVPVSRPRGPVPASKRRLAPQRAMLVNCLVCHQVWPSQA